ncbi:MAG: polyprenyl synthetase family protein [Pseudomonadota bacterium]
MSGFFSMIRGDFVRAVSASDQRTTDATRTDADPFAEAAAGLRRLNERDLARVNEVILDQLQSPVSMIPELAGHLLESGGKRVRPLLTLSAAGMFDYDGEDHVRLAATVELIHAATLLHDDVVDGSKLRRGLTTANILWGNKESVLVGDFIFSRAFELMVSVGKLDVLRVLSRASGVIAEGEVMQLATQKNVDTTFEMYLAVIEAKTAALFSAAAEVGARVAVDGAAVHDRLASFGANLGVAFQLVDDALDYGGYESALGKNVGDDFREGKMTLPVVYALDRATAEEKDFWRRTLGEGRQRDGDLERARAILDANDALADTFACARRYAERALDDLAGAPANTHRDALAALAEVSAARTF